MMNGHFDTDNPDKVIHKGEYENSFDNMREIALAPNTHKFVLNFWTEDLKIELERIRTLDITDNLTKIKYVCNVRPYYYFQFSDPDGNIIEVTGKYTPKEGQFV
ncbi:VOC family protein [Lacrimispora sp.]|uniref:VOC family protein n=1 Tax=Lacrimispora sp. TaxID=2719234 RepID=UPI003994A325